MLASPCLPHKGKMVDNDVSLDGVVGLALPNTRCFLQTKVVAERQLSQPALLHGVGVMDNDFSPDVIPVLIALGKNRSNGFLFNIPFVHISCVMGNDDRLAFVTCEALRSKDIFREPKLPSRAAVWIGVLEDAHRSDNGVVNEIPFFGEVGLIELYAVKGGALASRSEFPFHSSSQVLSFHHINHLRRRILAGRWTCNQIPPERRTGIGSPRPDGTFGPPLCQQLEGHPTGTAYC